ncbi:MAG: hypothetical protein ABIN80_10470 [Dyadobacter sp.]
MHPCRHPANGKAVRRPAYVSIRTNGAEGVGFRDFSKNVVS